jgi:predicted MFS family arabinose efflux permease
MTGSRIVGPALAGALITTVGFAWCFLLDGVSYLAVLAGLWRMDATRLSRAPLARRGKGQVREGIRYARSVPELWIPLVMMAVIGTLAFNFQTVLPLFATRDLGGSTVTFTLLMSVLSAGSLVGALATARRRTIGMYTVSVAAIAFGAAMAVLAAAPNRPVAFAAGLFVGLSSISFMTASTAIVQMTSTPSMRGRILALQSMVLLGSTPIGGPIVGVIAQRYGARYSIALGAIATLAAGCFGVAKVRGRARPVVVDERAPALPDEDALLPELLVGPAQS